MSLVESLETRRLYAVTPDASFGTDGRIKFSIDTSVSDMLATGAEIYVLAYQRARNRTVIFKYTDAGELDTTWGRGGYVVPQVFATPPKYEDVTQILVRDNRTGGLLVADVDDQPDDGTTRVGVQRFAANGRVDTAWGTSGRIEYSETRTELDLPRVLALPHKRVMLVLDRQRLLGPVRHGFFTRQGASDVALLRFDSRGRYDRAFNAGHALTVASGNYQSTESTVDQFTTRRTEDYTDPTFGDVQFFKDGTFRVVSTRNRTLNTTTTFNVDVITSVGNSVYSAESATVAADGTLASKKAQAYTLRRFSYDDSDQDSTIYYTPRAAVADADGTGVSVLASVDTGNGPGSTAIVRVGPGYRSRPEALPGPFATRYFGGVHRTGDGVFLAQSGGVGSADPDDNTPGYGPAVLSLGRDLVIGRHKLIYPLTYFPEFSLSDTTLDDAGRLLVEDTNLDTNTFDITRYA